MRKESHNLSKERLVTQTGSSELLIRVVVNPDDWKWSLNLLRCSEWEPSPTRAINKDSVTWILGSRAQQPTRVEWHHVGPWTKPGWTDHLISAQPRYPGYPGCAPGAAWYLGTRGTVCTWVPEVHEERYMETRGAQGTLLGMYPGGDPLTSNTQSWPSGKVPLTLYFGFHKGGQ